MDLSLIHICLGSSLVVYDGSVFLVSGNGIKALAHVKRLCGAEFMQFLVYADFGLSACGNGLFQPFQEFHQSHTVALHSCMDACYLLLIADGFQ